MLWSRNNDIDLARSSALRIHDLAVPDVKCAWQVLGHELPKGRLGVVPFRASCET